MVPDRHAIPPMAVDSACAAGRASPVALSSGNRLPPPTDSTLLYNGVQVLSQTLAKATPVLQVVLALARPVLRDPTRSSKHQMKRIMQTARRVIQGVWACHPVG
jgi:hypothetical protein